MHQYITPHFSAYSSLEDFMEPKAKNRTFSWEEDDTSIESPQSISDFAKYKRAFIVGEPGCGKSTLLRLIAQQLAQHDRKTAFIPLNQLVGKNIEELINNAHKFNGGAEVISDKPDFKSENFELKNGDNITICLDALDEISPAFFNETLNKIRDFSNIYSEVFILISCRRHYIESLISKFIPFKDYQYIAIDSFSDIQIRDFIAKNYNFQKDIVDALIKNTYTNNKGSVLQVPRYLEVLAETIKEDGLTAERVAKIKRVDFFEKFIYKKLETEVSTTIGKANEVILTKRVLEKLALIMEIYQTTRITKDELITFLDDTNSNANLIFLNHYEIETFITRVLKSFGEKIEFDNTEFQEYLAAKELLRLGQKSQILYDLIIEPNLKQIYTNWYDVLRYVLEIEASQIVPVVAFLKQKGNYLVSDDFFTLISTVDNNALSEDHQSFIFETLFRYHQKGGVYFDIFKARLLTNYFKLSNYKEFSGDTKISSTEDERLLINQVLIIQQLIKANRLTQEQSNDWSDRLLEVSQFNLFPNLQSCALYCLSEYQDLSLFIRNLNCYKISKKAVRKDFIYAISRVNPNSNLFVKFIIHEATAGNTEAKKSINSVTNHKQIGYLLLKLINDLDFLYEFCKQDGYYYSNNYQGLINNIDQNYSDDIGQKVKLLLKAIFGLDSMYRNKADELIKSLITIAVKHDSNYLLELLTLVPSDYFFRSFEKLISNVILPYQVDGFVKKAKTLKYGDTLTERLFFYIKHSDNPKKDQIYEMGRIYYEELYKIWEAPQEPEEDEELKKLRIYNKFKNQLTSIPGYYDSNLFSTFYNNSDVVQAKASATDIKRLKVILLDLFARNDLNDFSLKLSPKKNNSRTISFNNRFLFSLGFYLKVALELRLDCEIKKYRKLFVQYLPISSDEGDVNFIINYLNELDDEDITNLLEICKNRSDHFLQYSPSNFISIIRRVKRKEFIPFLINYAEDGSLEFYEKEKAIDCLGYLTAEEAYIISLFKKYNTNNEIALAEATNAVLIRYYRNKEAIEWRFTAIQNRKKPYIRNYDSGPGYVSNWELEIDNPKFFQVIINLIDQSLIPKIKTLLDFSFDIRTDYRYTEYSNYIFRVVYEFYKALKNLEDFKILLDLKRYINSHQNQAGAISFKEFLRSLEIEYLDIFGKATNISDSVKKYNELKATRFHTITSSMELARTVQEVLYEDIITFVQKEGFYKPIQYLTGQLPRKKKNRGGSKNPKAQNTSYAYVNEDAIQKTLKIQIENCLLKRGIRDIDIHREVQLHNDLRLDLLVNYGFIGPVMLELKLLHNPEICDATKRNEYKKKLKKYLEGSYSDFGIYAIFKVKNNPKHDEAFNDLKNEYSDLENLNVILIDCTIV